MDMSNSSFESNTSSIIRRVSIFLALMEGHVLTLFYQVEFLNVQDQYCYDEDLICEYVLVGYEPEEHDRVSIYKIGWTHIKEYILFEWAPICAKQQQVQKVNFNRKNMRNCFVQQWNVYHFFFQGPSLPKNSSETMYHFCYISGDNKVLGASPPFQFCAEVSNSCPDMSFISAPVMCSSFGSLQTADSIEKDKEIASLREENTLLKQTLKMLVDSKCMSNVQKEVEQLKSMVQFFQKALYLQEKEISNVKHKLEEKDSLRNTEKFKSLNIIDVGDLETLPPFPKCL